MKITKRQLRRIIAEEKQRLSDGRRLNEEEVDPAEFLYGEVDAMYLAAKGLREQLNELEDQMRDVIHRIPGRAMPKSRKAVMLNALILAADALDDLERHFYEAYDKMGGSGQL